jgi:hypothetical protein
VRSAFIVRMYPNQPDGKANELAVSAEAAQEALTKAFTLFRSEDWRVKGTFFEVSQEKPEGGKSEPILRAVLQD